VSQGEGQGAFVLKFRLRVQGLLGSVGTGPSLTQGELKPVLLGGMSGLHGFAGVCEKAGEGRGAKADSRGSGPGAGDSGSGTAAGAAKREQEQLLRG